MKWQINSRELSSKATKRSQHLRLTCQCNFVNVFIATGVSLHFGAWELATFVLLLLHCVHFSGHDYGHEETRGGSNPFRHPRRHLPSFLWLWPALPFSRGQVLRAFIPRIFYGLAYSSWWIFSSILTRDPRGRDARIPARVWISHDEQRTARSACLISSSRRMRELIFANRG